MVKTQTKRAARKSPASRKVTRKVTRKASRTSSTTTSRTKTRKQTTSNSSSLTGKGKAVSATLRAFMNARDNYNAGKIMKRVNRLYSRTKNPTLRQIRLAVTGQ